MTSNDLDVVVIGNIGIDTNVYLYGADVDFSVEANFSDNVDYIGQAGGFAARGYRRLGRRTAFVGHVGDDYSGRFIRETLHGDGIDTSALWIDPAGTSRSVNIMYRDGRRKNFYDGKSHMTLEPDLDAAGALFRRARLAHFNLPNWGRRLLPLARRHGVTVACDVQDVVDVDDPYRRDFVAQADILFFSAVNHDDPAPLMDAFLARNPRLLLVAGMGARGCAVGGAAGISYHAAVDHPAPVVDTNGAGDSLAVGFLDGYVLEGLGLDEAVRRGLIAARHTCTLRASSDDLIDRATLERRAAS